MKLFSNGKSRIFLNDADYIKRSERGEVWELIGERKLITDEEYASVIANDVAEITGALLGDQNQKKVAELTHELAKLAEENAQLKAEQDANADQMPDLIDTKSVQTEDVKNKARSTK